MSKYFFVVESETPPQVFLHDVIPNVGKIIELKAEELPNRVSAAWLEERYPFSRKLIIDKLRAFNKGSDTKHSYDPREVMPVMDDMNLERAKRQSRRKN